MWGSMVARLIRTRWGLLVVSSSLVLALGALAGARAEATTIRRIRSASGDDFTRIVIDVTGGAKYRYGVVPSGKGERSVGRFYIDLEGVSYPGKQDELGGSIADPRVVGVRTAVHKPGVTRVVFDLLRPVKTNVFSLPSPPRIVIDLTDDDSGSFAVAKARPAVPPTQSARTQAARPAIIQSAGARTDQVDYPQRTRIVIDPGHGGRDPGAEGLNGVREKNVVLDISRRVAEKLKRRLNVDVYLTRNSDTFVPLDKRKDLANRLEADLFVSIHANASKNGRMHGVETYYLKNTNDRATLRLASLENGITTLIKGSDVSTDADLPYILSDMVQGQKEAESTVLASHIQNQVTAFLKPRYHSVQDLGVKQGPFLVLDGTYMPSVLVETAFVTSGLESKRLSSPTYREAVAEGIYRGIKRYLADERITRLD